MLFSYLATQVASAEIVCCNNDFAVFIKRWEDEGGGGAAGY